MLEVEIPTVYQAQINEDILASDIQFAVEEITSVARLEELGTLIQNLADNAVEPNSFFEPWMLIPAIENALIEGSFTLALVRDGNRPESNDSIVGLFPLLKKRFFRCLPFSHYTSASHLHCFLSNPLIRKGREAQCLASFFEWFDKNSKTSLLELSGIVGEGPFYEALNKLLLEDKRNFYISEEFSRAVLTKTYTKEEFISDCLSRKKRKDLRRKRRQLEELGDLKVEVLEEQEQLAKWTDQFLNMESAGWKGSAGTAIKLNTKENSFFRAVLKGAFKNGKLIMLRLCLNGEPIAMRCSFKANDTVFSYKITYKEDYSRYSPGVLLEIENLDYLTKQPEIKNMDSCADPKKSFFEHMWPDKRTISSLVVSSKSHYSKFLVKNLSRIQSALRMLKIVFCN